MATFRTVSGVVAHFLGELAPQAVSPVIARAPTRAAATGVLVRMSPHLSSLMSEKRGSRAATGGARSGPEPVSTDTTGNDWALWKCTYSRSAGHGAVARGGPDGAYV